MKYMYIVLTRETGACLLKVRCGVRAQGRYWCQARARYFILTSLSFTAHADYIHTGEPPGNLFTYFIK